MPSSKTADPSARECHIFAVARSSRMRLVTSSEGKPSLRFPQIGQIGQIGPVEPDFRYSRMEGTENISCVSPTKAASSAWITVYVVFPHKSQNAAHQQRQPCHGQTSLVSARCVFLLQPDDLLISFLVSRRRPCLMVQSQKSCDFVGGIASPCARFQSNMSNIQQHRSGHGLDVLLHPFGITVPSKEAGGF